MKSYSLDAFSALPSQKDAIKEEIELTSLPDIELVQKEAQWTDDMVELFEKDREEVEDRSSALARMAYSAAEMGWSDEQIMSVLYALDDRWGKYTARRKATRDNIILNLVSRAREKVGYSKVDINLSKFLGDPETPTVDVSVNGGSKLVWGFQDFVEADFPINWMIEGLLPEQGLGMITGFPGSGKTQFALQLGAQLALDHEKFLKWPIIGQDHKVLFVSLEMGPAPFHLFSETIGQSYEDKPKLNTRLRLAPLGEPIPLDTKAGQHFLDNLLEEERPTLLIIDSLQAAMSKEMTDEISAKNLMHYLMRTKSHYNCAIVLIHHNRKKSAEAKRNDITELSDIYGSVMFTANADFALGLSKKSESNFLSVHSLKIRLGIEPPPFEVIRDEHLHFSMEFENIMENFGGTRVGGGESVDL